MNHEDFVRRIKKSAERKTANETARKHTIKELGDKSPEAEEFITRVLEESEREFEAQRLDRINIACQMMKGFLQSKPDELEASEERKQELVGHAERYATMLRDIF